MSRRLTAHFRYDELACRCGCGRMEFSPDALHELEETRVAFGAPMILSSGYRCPEHNAEVSKTGRHGPHTVTDGDSLAVDVLAFGSEARRLVGVLIERGWNGIGLHQKGPRASRFVHADRVPVQSPRHPRPWIWSY